MKGFLRITAAAIIGLSLMSVIAGKANAWYSCDQYGTWSDGTLSVCNNVWGTTSGSQCINVNNAGSWTASANFSGGGIKSYPNTYFKLNNVSVWAPSAINTSFSASWPSDSMYDLVYDIWSQNNSDEIMIWESWANGIGPISNSYQCSNGPSWACPIYSNQYIDGTYWNVFQGNPGWNVVSFMRTSQTGSGSQNVLALMQWAANHGLLNSQTISSVGFGFEVTSTNGTENFSLNSYSASVSYGSSSSYSSNISNGNHAVVPQCATGARLDAYGWNGGNGTKVEIWNGSTQTWAFTNNGSGIYQIAEAWNTGACLDVTNFGGAGTATEIWGCWGGSPQQWGAISDGGSIYEFEPQCSKGTRLDVWGASSNSGTTVAIWNANGGSNQKWAVN